MMKIFCYIIINIIKQIKLNNKYYSKYSLSVCVCVCGRGALLRGGLGRRAGGGERASRDHWKGREVRESGE